MDQNHSKLKTIRDLYTFCEQANITQLNELIKKEKKEVFDERSKNIALRKAINNFDNKNPNYERIFEILLLKLGVNLDYQDAQDDKNENSTIIDLLCMKGNLDLIKLILHSKNEKKSNNRKINFSLIDSHGRNLFHYLLSQSTIEKQELDAVEIFNYFFNEYNKINSSSKNEFIKLIQKPDNNGNDALAISLLNGWYKITQLILQQIPQHSTLNQICNSDGNNYIHCAIKGNNIKCLIVVLYYSDLKHLEDKNHDNLTPLKLAEDKGRLCAVKLIEHFKMNFKKKVYKENSNVIEQLNQLNRFTLLKLYHNKEYEKTGNLIELYKLMENIKYQYLNNCNNIINENFTNNSSNNIGIVQLSNNNSNSSLLSSYEGENISVEWNLLLTTYKQVCNKNIQINTNNININGSNNNHKNKTSSNSKKHKNTNNISNNNTNISFNNNTNNNIANNINTQYFNSLFPLCDEMKTFFNKYLNKNEIQAYYEINNTSNNNRDNETKIHLNQSLLPLDILIYNKIIFFLHCNDINTVLETIDIYFTIVYPSNNEAYYKWITFINISLILIEILISYNYNELASKLIEIIDKVKQPTPNTFLDENKENIETYLNDIEVFTQKALVCYYINLLKMLINIENDNKNEYEKLIEKNKDIKIYPIFNKLQKWIEIKRNYFLNNRMKCFTNIEKCKNEESKIFYFNTLGILNIKLKKYTYAELQFRNALNVYSKLFQKNRKSNINAEIRIDFIYMIKFNLGLALFLRKEYEKAKNIFTSLTKAKMFNKNFYLWYRLGLCYLEMELNTQAKNDKGYNDLIKDIKGFETNNKKEQNRISINLSQDNDDNEMINENKSQTPNIIINKTKDKYYNNVHNFHNNDNDDLDDLYIQFEREYCKENISSLTPKQIKSPSNSQQIHNCDYNTNTKENYQYDSNECNTKTSSHRRFIIRDYNYSASNNNSTLSYLNYKNKKTISYLKESISAFKQCIIIANNSVLRKPILDSIHDFYMKLNKNEDYINKNNSKTKDTFQNDYSTSFSHKKENLLPIINAYINLLFALTLKEEWLQIIFYIKEFKSHNFQIPNEIDIKIKSFLIEALIHLGKYTQAENEIKTLLKLYQNENYRFNYYCKQNINNYSDIHFKAGLYYNLCLVSLKKNKIKEAEEYIKLIYGSYTFDQTYLPGYLVHLIVYINLIKYNNYKQKGDLIEDSISKKNKYIKNAIALIKTRREMAVPKFYNGH